MTGNPRTDSAASEAGAIKAAVREGYTGALARTSGGSGCCGGSAATERVERLGYAPESLAGVPEEALSSAFGCGNPFAFTDVQAGQVVLDVGSGAGIDCFVAARAVGPTGRVIGVDMTPAMIDAARANAARAGLDHVEFRQGEADAMPVPDASVDWVFSNCVINLAPDKRAVFDEVVRVLKPGGRVAISDIVLSDELPREVVESVDALVGCVAGAVREGEYLDAMREAGLTGVEVLERLPYTLSAAADQGDGCGCGCDGDEGKGQHVLERYADVLRGKVWSARISARRPATTGD